MLTGLGGGFAGEILKGVASLTSGSAVLGGFAKAGMAAFGFGFLGGSAGSTLSDLLDGTTPDGKKAVSTGLINGTIAGLVSVVGSVPAAIPKEYQGVSAIISAAIEGAIDPFSTAITSRGK